MLKQVSIGKDAASALAKTKWWEGRTAREIATYGVLIRELCIPFDLLHKSVEEALGRPVWTHEFASERLYDELLGNVSAPTFDDVLKLIPEDKLALIVIDR